LSLKNIVAGALSLFFAFAVSSVPALAQCTNSPNAVLTAQYDNNRDNVNADETCLTPASGTFFATDGVTPIFVQKALLPTTLPSGVVSPIYAQPLYVPNVVINGAAHNVIFTAALNGVVYAYDADNYGAGSPGLGVLYWFNSLTSNCGETINGTKYPASLVELPVGSKLPYLGIVSTPVIDIKADILYVVNACVASGPVNNGMQWYLSALRLATGKFVAPPIRISGGVTNSYGSTPFVPDWQLQRAALLLTKQPSGESEVYIAFGAGTEEGPDQNPYHGWLFGYSMNAAGTALVQEFVFTTTPTATSYSSMCDAVLSSGDQLPPNWCGEAGGIWMSGRGPAAATLGGTPYVFVAASNGGFQTAQPLNWSESVLKFPVGSTSTPSDSFTPSGWYLTENAYDQDLGTSGVLLFSGIVDGVTNYYLVVTDKEGNLFLLTQENLGGFFAPDRAVQEFLASASAPCTQQEISQAACNEPHSMAYWNDTLYMWPLGSQIRAFTFSNGQFLLPAVLGGAKIGYPGGSLAVSSNGTANGILWALYTASARGSGQPGTLAAIDPASLATVWSSTDAFRLSTFNEPTVINGRVYVPTYDHGLLIYANH
jgi:hypothetical protein